MRTTTCVIHELLLYGIDSRFLSYTRANISICFITRSLIGYTEFESEFDAFEAGRIRMMIIEYVLSTFPVEERALGLTS